MNQEGKREKTSGIVYNLKIEGKRSNKKNGGKKGKKNN